MLVGAGHSNLAVVRRARALRRVGIAVTLVDPDAFWYSGMATPMLGGAVAPWRDRIDPAPAASRRGVRFVRARVDAIDLPSRTVVLDDGRELAASAVVCNVGSDLDARGLPVDRPDVTPAKPIAGLRGLHDRLCAGPRRPRIVVVGGGATAVEAAGNLTAGPLARAVAPHVTVVAGPAPLAVVDDPALRARLLAPLHDRGVVWEQGPRAVDVTDSGVVLDDGRTLPADHVLLATGLRASRAVEHFGLGDARGMPVTATLQHPDHPWLFGAGDAVRFLPRPLPRLGVFAVRQAPVLLDNLVALHTGAELRDYEPQDTWITAVDLGGGDAVVIRGDQWFGGRGALVAKRLLDEWFLRRHRVRASGSSGSSDERAAGPTVTRDRPDQTHRPPQELP